MSEKLDPSGNSGNTGEETGDENTSELTLDGADKTPEATADDSEKDKAPQNAGQMGDAALKLLELESGEQVTPKKSGFLILPPNLATCDVRVYGWDREVAQTSKAEWYNDAVDARRPDLRAFMQLPGANRGRINSDMREVTRLETIFAQNSAGDDRIESIEFWDKTLESLFYAIAERGVFDSADGRTARPIFTSKYDDYTGGVDCALEIPFSGKAKDGSRIRTYIPIAVDVTGSSSMRTIETGKFGKHTETRQGIQIPEIYSMVHYSQDADGQLSTDRMMLRYIIGMDRSTMKDDLLRGENIESPSNKVKKMLYRQLRDQSLLKMDFLSTTVGAQNWTQDQALAYKQARRLYSMFDRRLTAVAGKNNFTSVGSKSDAQQMIVMKTNSLIGQIRGVK